MKILGQHFWRKSLGKVGRFGQNISQNKNKIHLLLNLNKNILLKLLFLISFLLNAVDSLYYEKTSESFFTNSLKKLSRPCIRFLFILNLQEIDRKHIYTFEPFKE